MSIRPYRCGPFVNHSEKVAFEYILSRLQSNNSKDDWVLLSNYANVRAPHQLPDDLDLVVIGPSGVFIIEIKHWGAAEAKDSSDIILNEAIKLNEKAKRLKGKLNRNCNVDTGFVAGKFLFTRGEKETYRDGLFRKRINGIEIFGLTEWRDLLEVDLTKRFSNQEINIIFQSLNPPRHAANDDRLKQFQQFVNLELVSLPSDTFRRVFRGYHRDTRDKVLLHVYDLSIDEKPKTLEAVARRESEVLQKLQKSRWLPMLRDTFQEAKAYPGELFFFAYLDSEAPTLAERIQDTNWTLQERLDAVKQCIDALLEIHGFNDHPHAEVILHRNLTPRTIRIRSNNRPLLTQLHCAKLPGALTVAGLALPEAEALAEFAAPEVRQSGIAACTVSSDIYAMCASLLLAFNNYESEPLAKAVRDVLQKGLDDDPTKRCDLNKLRQALDLVEGAAQYIEMEAKILPIKYWDEDTVVPFRDRHYRIVTRLGVGSVGTTFKVVEVDQKTNEHLSGPYVAKVITNHIIGKVATMAYARVRAQTGSPHLAGVLEVATEWQPGQITALLKWIEGESLSEWIGTLPLYFDEFSSEGRDAVAMRWILYLCEGLASLHRNGLVHGDVSPRNIIVHGDMVTLTDFDLATKVGSVPLFGTFPYCSANVDARTSITPSDDIFALAATFFHVLFDRLPFEFPNGPDKHHGLNWEGIDYSEWTHVREFFDRATHPDLAQRFASAIEALEFVKLLVNTLLTSEQQLAEPQKSIQLTPNDVPWLRQLLQSYPGSPKGNAETRGLDSDFARQTYVETGLDSVLVEDIRSRRVNLVILCGNVGDGKTAFLQHLAATLKPDEVYLSSQRFWDFELSDGLRIRANLDGSAAFEGRSAKELLDEIFAPFHTREFSANLVHLVAINDGPLLNWLEAMNSTYLTEQLEAALGKYEETEIDSRIRFVDLNARSLVGGIANGNTPGSTNFLDHLLNKLIGDSETWISCQTCTAQNRCHAFQSVQELSDPDGMVRERLAKALRAVHQRGEIHITARNLRASLVYMFFGINDCYDLHTDPELQPAHYSYRAFDAASEYRQGELLRELQILDPALESHSRIDRYLLQTSSSKADLNLAAMRRKAYFQWSNEKICEVGGSETALGLAQGRHLDTFWQVGSGTDEDRAHICRELCEGLARMEDLPEQAFQPGFVPMKITQRTTTETIFWVNKPSERFTLRAVLPRAVNGVETLHTGVELVYSYNSNSEQEEILNIGAELFNLLMELKDGYQLSDMRSDGVFANLSIFKQRLAQEDDSQLFAWTPLDDGIFKLHIVLIDGFQKLVISPVKDIGR